MGSSSAVLWRCGWWLLELMTLMPTGTCCCCCCCCWRWCKWCWRCSSTEVAGETGDSRDASIWCCWIGCWWCCCWPWWWCIVVKRWCWWWLSGEFSLLLYKSLPFPSMSSPVKRNDILKIVSLGLKRPTKPRPCSRSKRMFGVETFLTLYLCQEMRKQLLCQHFATLEPGMFRTCKSVDCGQVKKKS